MKQEESDPVPLSQNIRQVYLWLTMKRESTDWLTRFSKALMAFTGSVLGLGLVSLMHELLYGTTDLPLIIAAFGATAVVLYGYPESPIAQPKNLFTGSLLSAFVGVVSYHAMHGFPIWFVGMIAISTALFLMTLTSTLHPPGGAIAFIAVAGPPEIHQLGLLYLIYPIGTGIFLMYLVALLMNRLTPKDQRPSP